MIALDGIALPDDLVWQDEFGHDAVAQSRTRTEGGALIVEETKLLAGRPITLSGDRESGWIQRSVLLELQALSEVANAAYELQLHDGRTFDVIFARPNPLTGTPIIPFNNPVAGDFYAVTIRLITV